MQQDASDEAVTEDEIKRVREIIEEWLSWNWVLIEDGAFPGIENLAQDLKDSLDKR